MVGHHAVASLKGPDLNIPQTYSFVLCKEIKCKDTYYQNSFQRNQLFLLLTGKIKNKVERDEGK